MNTLFQLDKYQIESVSIKANPEYKKGLSGYKGDIKVGFTVGYHNTDKKKSMLSIQVELSYVKGQEDMFFPYFVSIKGNAFFTFNDDLDRANIEKFMSLNGASILYGLLRGQVAQITAQSVNGQFLMPVVNFMELAQKKNEKEQTSASIVREPKQKYLSKRKKKD